MEKQSKRTLGLRRRWMTSSLLPVITILVLISALEANGLGSSY